jgi:hypothetical protein
MGRKLLWHTNCPHGQSLGRHENYDYFHDLPARKVVVKKASFDPQHGRFQIERFVQGLVAKFEVGEGIGIIGRL